MNSGVGDWHDEPGVAPLPPRRNSSVIVTRGLSRVEHTALGPIAVGAVEQALELLLRKMSADALGEALQAPAGEFPDWESGSDDEDPSAPSWLGHLRQSVREATEAALIGSLAVDDGWDAPPPKLLYPNSLEWVQHWLLPTYRRGVPETGETSTWCPQWWEHPEAVIRLSALWHGFEMSRLEAGDAFSSWLRDHLDHHMSVLLSARGPFEHCTIGDGHNTVRALKPLPMMNLPKGLAAFLG